MSHQNKSRLLRMALLLSLLVNVGCGVFLLHRYFVIKGLKAWVPPPKLPYYLNRDKLFETLTVDTGAVVFLGTSLTQYYELAEFFPGVKVKNRGIHGDMLDKVLLRLSPIISARPKKIFIELGGNDVEQLLPQDKLLSMYARLLDTLKTTCPASRLYVQSLLPVADTSVYVPSSYCSPANNKKIVAVNEALQKLAATRACTFIDLHRHFLRNQELAPAYSVDGLHLSGEGYALWTKILKPYVEE